MKILDLYKSILSTAALVADKEGNISAVMHGNSVPFTVGGKRMVLPTPEHLANPDRSNREIFHPLSENILRGESVIMEKFRSAINTRLNFVLGALMNDLLVLSTSVGEHSKLDPDQSKILSLLKDADEKTLVNFKAILKAMGFGDKEKCIVHLFLKRGGMVDGKKYTRAAIVSFPLYKELEKGEKQVYGVTIRNRDREAYMNLLQFIIPGVQTAGKFDRGSESDIAPFLDAVMRALLGIAGNISAVVDDYQKFLSKPEDFVYNSDWVEVFDNLAQMLPEIRSIPMQAGNEGKVEGGRFGAPAAPTFSVAAPVAAPVHAGFHTPAPAPVAAGPVLTSNGGLDFASLMNKNPQMAGHSPYGAPRMNGPEALRAGTPAWAQPNTFGNFNQPMQPPMMHNQWGNSRPMGGGFGNI